MSGTPLELWLREHIAAHGAMRMDEYMRHCLWHEEHGYYRRAQVIGGKGDFVTAPEVSQMFGEMLAMWVLAAWQSMGAPEQWCLCELGGGRGVLMADMLRTLKQLAGKIGNEHAGAPLVAMVEKSPAMRAQQAEALGDVLWAEGLDALPPQPTIIIGNEFLDAMPIRQWKRIDAVWQEAMVDVEGAALCLSWQPLADGDVARADALAEAYGSEAGDIVEVSDEGERWVAAVAAHVKAYEGAALWVDYGPAGFASGDTLQAVRKQAFGDVLGFAGEADLSAHVPFAHYGALMARAGVEVAEIITQQQFLLEMGLSARAVALAKAQPDMRLEIERAMARLAGGEEMGTLFKVLACKSL